MIDKKLTALAGSVLLLAAAMPFAMAHGPGNDDVSGTYYGSAAAYVDSPTLGGVSSFAFALCDVEVLSSGDPNDPLRILDEGDVDGTSTGGVLPEGTFDDGGVGAACHTNGHYADPGYNTPGCSGDSFANDLAFGGAVWIGAACDWKATDSGPGFTTCVTNELISSPTVAGLSDCVNNLLGGPSPVPGDFESCGNDGVADSVDYDTGSNGATYGNGAVADGCDPVLDASAVTFVFPYVDETTAAAVVPTTGSIHQ